MRSAPCLFAISALFAASVASARNFIVNGDFSEGNKGFITTYKYVAPATDALFVESNYTIASNTKDPYVLNTKGITDYKDHTSSDGLFFLVNGAKNRNSLVWEQTIKGLRLGQRYRFTLWVSRWTPNQSTAAKLSILIDDVEYDSFEDPNVSGVWVKHTISFMPSSQTPVIQIRNLESALYGNDFALDDLSIVADADPSTNPPPPQSVKLANILARAESDWLLPNRPESRGSHGAELRPSDSLLQFLLR